MNPKFIQPSVVAGALYRLRSKPTHTLFPGYLHLKQRSIELDTLKNLKPDFKAFYRKFFQVANHPLGSPYIKIFTEKKPSSQNLWLNENVAGSYAPSSLRPNQSFRQVVIIQNKEYSMPEDHAELAFDFLMSNEKVSVVDLSIFLYRDYGFVKENFKIEDLVSIFAFEFGYSDEPDGTLNDEFHILFDSTKPSTIKENWLEVI
jgi:hypothetical protein